MEVQREVERGHILPDSAGFPKGRDPDDFGRRDRIGYAPMRSR